MSRALLSSIVLKAVDAVKSRSAVALTWKTSGASSVLQNGFMASSVHEQDFFHLECGATKVFSGPNLMIVVVHGRSLLKKEGTRLEELC